MVRFGDSMMQLGDIGTEFKYETNNIRVWDLILSPGQCSDWHRHESLYVFIVTRPGTLKTEYEDGSTSTNQFELGEVVQGQKGRYTGSPTSVMKFTATQLLRSSSRRYNYLKDGITSFPKSSIERITLS